jgi:cytochrome bd-type quinol oxidase subunit 1
VSVLFRATAILLLTPALVTGYVLLAYRGGWQLSFPAGPVIVGVLALAFSLWVALRGDRRDYSGLAVLIPLLSILAILLAVGGWFWATCSSVNCL